MMENKLYRVKVNKISSPKLWYAKKTGFEYDVINENLNKYRVLQKNGKTSCLLLNKKDVTILYTKRAKAMIRFEISKSKNGEYKVTPKHINGNILFKETYKLRSTLKRILSNTIKCIHEGDYEIVNN